MKIGGMKKNKRKTGGKRMLSLLWFRVENIGEKNPSGPQIFILDLGGKLGRKERKGQLST